MAGISLFGLAVAGIFPDRPGTQGVIHNIGAYTMATGMYLCVLGVTIYGTFPTWLTGLTWLATLIMSFGILIALISLKQLKDKLLYYQAAFMGTFYLIMILATYFHS